MKDTFIKIYCTIMFVIIVTLAIMYLLNVPLDNDTAKADYVVPRKTYAPTDAPKKVSNNTEINSMPSICPKKTSKTVKAEYTPKVQKSKFEPISECSWSKKTQKKISKICKSYGISFELVMSMAMRESDFRENLMGDNGKAYGAWQIHYWEWKSLMDELGYSADDMFNPIKQADACCAILEIHYKELNRTTYALMAYNGGSAYAKRMMKAGKISNYASEVKGRAEEWKER